MHVWHFEYIVGPRPQIQSLTARGYQPACLRSVTSGLRGTSVTVRGIGVLNKWLKCATETQSGSTCNRCACSRFKTPEQPLSYKASDRQSLVNVKLWINFKLICWCVNLHQKVWYKSEKAFGLWSEWHYTTRGLVYGYIITRATRSWLCIHPPISLVV